MSDANRPVVNPSLVASVRGPVIMITIGGLFLLQKFNILQFEQSWPIILIVVGALALAGGGRRVRGRGVNPAAPISPNYAPPDYTPPNYTPPNYGPNVPPYVPPTPPPPGVRR